MRTVVHVVRHGEVHNPDGVLYGRLPGYHLSDLGHEMARRVASALTGPPVADVVLVVASPLQRAQETAAPIAEAFGLGVDVDPDLIEAGNVFEGSPVSGKPGALLRPSALRHLWNPLRPSWGEPFAVQRDRMVAAVASARARAEGHEAVLVSHQSPIWALRRHLQGKPLAHDPRARECALASVTSLTFDGPTLVAHDYTEPAGELLLVAAPGAGA